MLELRDNVTTSQLYNCIQNVAAKKTHHALIEMLCCELKLVVDLCKKWIKTNFSSRLELSLATKKTFQEQNPLNFEDKCCICRFDLSVSKKYGPKSDKMSYHDFVIKKEYHFFAKMSERICDLETCYIPFEMFAYLCAHLCVKYNEKSLMENLQDEKIINFMVNAQFGDFQTLFQEITDTKVIHFERKNKRDYLRNFRIKTFVCVQRNI